MPAVTYRGRNLFYQEAGEGPVLIFLHGNTASSRLFEPLLPLYTSHFRCVLLDFLGNGRSDRTDAFPTDLWQDEARQALALIRAAGYEKPCLLGTSGGAWAAMNAALLAPDEVGAVVADSFDGRTLHPGFAQDLAAERAGARQDPAACGFYEWCQGGTGRRWWTGTRTPCCGARPPDSRCSAARWGRCGLRSFCWGAGRIPCADGIWRKNTPPWLRSSPVLPCASFPPADTRQSSPGRKRRRRKCEDS